jgi:hypothetical protein
VGLNSYLAISNNWVRLTKLLLIVTPLIFYRSVSQPCIVGEYKFAFLPSKNGMDYNCHSDHF